MKTVVSLQDLLQHEIKPNALLSEYYSLTAASVSDRWRDRSLLLDVACPGCGGADSSAAFDRAGLTYRLCRTCESLFVSPRPSEASLILYYRESPAARFWRDRLLPTTSAAREEKLIGPRVEWILDGIAETNSGARTALDLSPHGGTLVEALLARGPLEAIVAASALADLDHRPMRGLDIRPSTVDGVPSLGPVDVVLAFDVFDRTHDVPGLVQAIWSALRPGGLLFVTASNISGFELQVLWDRSQTITPPDKLNVLSLAGMRRLFAQPGWKIVELSTPGVFDVENVRRAVSTEPTHVWPRFIRQIIAADGTGRNEFQEYLQRQRLTSFARLVVQRAN